MTKTKPSAKILQAMEIIGDRKQWTKGEFARDSKGDEVGINNKSAVCFCSIGALDKAKAGVRAKDYVNDLVEEIYATRHVADFNDRDQTKHKHVMNMFMTAAFLALSEGK